MCVVLGDTNGANAELFGARDQILGREVGVGAAPIGMQMKIDGEVGPADAVPASRSRSSSTPYFGGVGRERDGLHLVALLNLIDHIHARNDAAENRVLTIETRLGLEADVELAAARFALRIDLIAGTRRRNAAAQMLFADFGRHGIARPPVPVPSGSPPCTTKSGTTR